MSSSLNTTDSRENLTDGQTQRGDPWFYRILLVTFYENDISLTVQGSHKYSLPSVLPATAFYILHC